MSARLQCVDDAAAALESGTLPLSVFSDPALFELEKERIFARSWIFLAHETEIPAAGDFVQRYIVDDAFIVTRDDSGTVRVLLNACRHRGRQLCRTEQGQAKYFSCPYHGWVYANNGELVEVPHQQHIYGPNGLDKTAWGLVHAAQVGIWDGWIFANLDPEAESLEEFLGDAPWYLDFYTKKSSAGLEVVGAPQRWSMPANWKLGTDNFIGDDYHVAITHLSTVHAGILVVPDADFLITAVPVSAGPLGGAVGDVPFQAFGYPDAMIDTLKSNVSPSQATLIDRGMAFSNGGMFPNLSFLNTGATLVPGQPPVPYFTVRVWQPVGPDRTEVWSWLLVEKDAPEAFKVASRRAYILSFGTSGTLEQDDAENWMSITRASRGFLGRQQALNYQMGLDHRPPLADWPGPGTAWPIGYTEANQRQFWRTWLDSLNG